MLDRRRVASEIDPDAVEADHEPGELRAGQESFGHPHEAASLAGVDPQERFRGISAARLDLDDREERLARLWQRHKVRLVVADPQVAGEDAMAAAAEVPGGEAFPAERVPQRLGRTVVAPWPPPGGKQRPHPREKVEGVHGRARSAAAPRLAMPIRRICSRRSIAAAGA